MSVMAWVNLPGRWEDIPPCNKDRTTPPKGTISYQCFAYHVHQATLDDDTHWLSLPRYITDKVLVKLVDIPANAVTHIQNKALGHRW